MNGTLHGLPVLSTNPAYGLLPSSFVGALVHDHGSAYERCQCLHAFYNTHHLRELIAITERSPSQPWTTDMITLLCQANAVVGEAQALETLPASNVNVEHLWTRYDTILSKAEAGNPPRPRRPRTRGRAKQSPAYNLIRRLRERRNEVLRFLTDLCVRFDNNQAERDLTHAQAQAESLWLLPLRY